MELNKLKNLVTEMDENKAKEIMDVRNAHSILDPTLDKRSLKYRAPDGAPDTIILINSISKLIRAVTSKKSIELLDACSDTLLQIMLLQYLYVITDKNNNCKKQYSSCVLYDSSLIEKLTFCQELLAKELLRIASNDDIIFVYHTLNGILYYICDNFVGISYESMIKAAAIKLQYIQKNFSEDNMYNNI